MTVPTTAAAFAEILSSCADVHPVVARRVTNGVILGGTKHRGPGCERPARIAARHRKRRFLIATRQEVRVRNTWGIHGPPARRFRRHLRGAVRIVQVAVRCCLNRSRACLSAVTACRMEGIEIKQE